MISRQFDVDNLKVIFKNALRARENYTIQKEIKLRFVFINIYIFYFLLN